MIADLRELTTSNVNCYAGRECGNIVTLLLTLAGPRSSIVVNAGFSFRVS